MHHNPVFKIPYNGLPCKLLKKAADMTGHRLILLFSATLALTLGTAFAEDLSPGLWEITMESRVANDAAWTPSPFGLTQCLSAADAKDPSKVIGSISTAGATGCTYTEKTYTGSTLRFALECTGTFALKPRGSVTFSANSFNGNITATSNMGGQTVEMQNRLAGKRLGNC